VCVCVCVCVCASVCVCVFYLELAHAALSLDEAGACVCVCVCVKISTLCPRHDVSHSMTYISPQRDSDECPLIFMIRGCLYRLCLAACVAWLMHVMSLSPVVQLSS